MAKLRPADRAMQRLTRRSLPKVTQSFGYFPLFRDVRSVALSAGMSYAIL